MSLDLTHINSVANPAFIDAKSCAEWLKALPLINVGPTHAKLLAEIEELNRFEMPPGERLKILEMLREAILFVQSEQARKFTGKAVPLAKAERGIFLDVLALWSAFAHGWRHCLQDLVAGIGGASTHAALICQRAMWSTGLKFAEHYRVYREIGPDEWRQINQIYAIAESFAADREMVSHPTQHAASDASCAESFIQVQLLALANPNEHSPRQQALVARWTELWARKAVLSLKAPETSGGMPLSVDLDADSCASREPKEAGVNIRFMDTHEIGKSLARRIGALKKGEAPDTLGLGNEVEEGLAAQMLVTLKQRWCDDKNTRQIPRRAAAQHADVCCGFAALYYFITDRPFATPAKVSVLTAQQREHIETFGQLSTRPERIPGEFVLEQWRILDDSPSGYRLERPRNSGSTRFLHQQLVAVRPSGSSHFSLCSARWISMTENSTLRIGAKAMPGIPQGIAVRIGGINAPTDKFVAGLMLPAVPALRTPATIVIPAGWFRPKRLIEIQSDGIEKAFLTSALERGSDFVRCSYEAG